MLTKKQMENYADVLLWGLKTSRKGRLKKNEVILIRYDLPAIKPAEVLYGKLLDMGMNPVLRSGLTSLMERTFYDKANNRQLIFVAPGEKEFCEGLSGSIYLNAPDSLTHLGNTDPKKIGKTAVSRKPLRNILQERENAGSYSWTLCIMPTEGLARQAGISLRMYTNQIIRACYLDRADPVSAWKSIHRDAAAVKKWMNSLDVKYYYIESGNIDLKIVPGKHRRWVGISGHNIPSFEIFLSPDRRGTEGRYYADQASFRSGNYVKGARLFFAKGNAVKIEAEKGEDFLVKQLSMDRGACRVGEFSLTDKRFSRINRFMANTLYDENFGGRYGNCHLALGSSYLDTYDGNLSELTKDKKRGLGFNDSALHWDLVNTEDKTVTAHLNDGKNVVVYEKGMFKY